MQRVRSLKRLYLPGRRRSVLDPFAKRYRLTLEQFNALLAKIRKKYPGWGSDNNAHAKRSSGEDGPVSGELRLSMLLRFLAGGSYLDVSDMHLGAGAEGGFYAFINDTMDKVLEVESFLFDGCPGNKDFDYVANLKHLLKDGRLLGEVMSGFNTAKFGEHCPGEHIPGGIGAMDGWAAKIRCPSFTVDNVTNQNVYFNRKDFYALAVQAICDSRLVFLHCNPTAAGAVHDSQAWKQGPLARAFRALKLETDGVAINGQRAILFVDDAYGCDEIKICRVPGRKLPCAPDAFNFLHSILRSTIERAFGVLMSRWGILLRPLKCSLARARKTIQCCMLLHNICIRSGADSSEDRRRYASGSFNKGEALKGDNDTTALDVLVVAEKQNDCYKREEWERPRRWGCNSSIRDHFIADIKDKGLKRPKPCSR